LVMLIISLTLTVMEIRISANSLDIYLSDIEAIKNN